MKNFTLIGTALLLLLSSFSLEARTCDFEVNGIYYTIYSGKAFVSAKDDTYDPKTYVGDVVIPSQVTYNNRTYTVAGLESFAFVGCDELRSVTVPETVTVFGAGVFEFCTALESVNIPDSLTVMGQLVFKNCTSLTHVDFPSTITTIPKETFYECSALTDFQIHQGVTTIEEMAFIGCKSLTHIDIPSSVTTIGAYAFSSTGLTEVVVPSTVTNLSSGVFSYCDNLVSVELPENMTSIPSSLFRECHHLPYVEIPSSVTYISGFVFSECYNLTHIELPDAITEIGENLFKNCYSLADVDIPENVTSIGYEAFNNCTTFTRIVIPPLVTSIGWAAFEGCKNVVSANLPPNMTEIPRNLFSGCSSLKEIEIPATVTNIQRFAFNGCTQLKKVNIPYGVTTIGDCAFRSCQVLEDVYIPPTVTTIGGSAFFDCRSLKFFEIPKAMNRLEGYTFAQCFNLKDFVMPLNVTSIGDNWFRSVGVMNNLSLVGEGEWTADSIQLYTTSNLYIDSKVTGVKGMCVRPTDVYCYATTPPECDERSFLLYTGTLHVKPSCVAAYFMSPYWSNFVNIVGDAVEPLGVDISDDYIELEVDGQFNLSATVNPANATPNTVFWQTSNPFVAVVDNGVVTAVGKGECDIIVSCLDRHAVCHVVVDVAPSAIITLDQQELRIKPNQIATLIPSATPQMPELAVSSSDMTVAAARVINGVVQVVGVSEGTATITVGSVDGTARPATCFVTVYTDRGDVNGDGIINIADLSDLIDYLLGRSVDGFTFENADANGDGEVSIADVSSLIDKILSKSNSKKS